MVNISGEPFCRPSFGPIDIFFLSLLWRGGGVFFSSHYLLTTPGELGLLGREGKMVKHHHYREEWETTSTGKQAAWDA